MSMKINRTAGPNKGQRRDSWVLFQKGYGPLMSGRALLVYACRSDAAAEAFGSYKPAKMNYNHLCFAYKRARGERA